MNVCTESLYKEASFLTNAMRFYIKWKVILGIACTAAVFLIAYKVFFYSDSPCDDGYRHVEAANVLNDYCNPPHLPATGQEGGVPLGEYSLISVHIVIRHGDRAAIHSLKNTLKQSIDCQIHPHLEESVDGMKDFYKMMSNINRRGGSRQNPYENYTTFPDSPMCERSSLTPLGVSQHVRNGRFLRERYSHHRLLNRDGLSDQILIRGTKYTRTFQSAVAFLYGLLPELDLGLLRFEMADNNTMCTRETQYECSCPAISNLLSVFSCTFHQELARIRESFGSEELYNHVSTLYHQLSKKIGLPEEDLPKMSHIFDVGITHFCHNKPLLTTRGDCVESLMIRSMYEAVNALGRKSQLNKDFVRIAKLKMQPLMYEIAHRMQAQARKRTSLKLVLYSGHDSTVDPLSCALGIATGVWPKYAARIVFELYARSGDEAFLRVLLDGVVVTGGLTFCRNRLADVGLGLCKIQHFLDFVDQDSLASIEEKDYKLACQRLLTI